MLKALLAGLVASIAIGTVAPHFQEGSEARSAYAAVTGSDKAQAGPFDLGGDRTVNDFMNTHNTTFNY